MRKLSILVSTLLLGFGLSAGAQNIRINEFATNGATQYNGMDWVELYNPSDVEVSLEGYTLDDAKSATEANTAILGGTIPAKGFKILVEGEDFSYGLGASGETLTLKFNDAVVDNITCVPNIAGKTLGRIADGAGSTSVTLAEGAVEAGGWKVYDEADATIGASNNIITVVYTSDQHYGITRSAFRGATNVNATVVNAAMVAQINKLNGVVLPEDGEAGSGTVMNINHIITTGDISNRAEPGIPRAAVTLAQFDNDYTNGITLQNFKGEKPALYLLPGNHDVSNAIGQKKIPAIDVDATTMTAIYNRMMQPATPKTTATYNYATDKINYVQTIAGVQFVFINMWADQSQRAWITANTNPELPIFIFAHDEPDVEVKHLTGEGLENLVNAAPSGETTTVGFEGEERDLGVQREFANFVAATPNIKAYFHGNTNFTEFYNYTGPDGNINLPTFRIDSPMKGAVSGDDETKLSFQLVTIDRATGAMTVREVLWNTTSSDAAPIAFGETRTIEELNNIQPSYAAADYTVPSWTLFQRTVKAGSPDASVLVSKNAPYNVNTAINENPASQMGITWYTNAGVTGSKLQLIEGTSGDFSNARVINATETELNNIMYVTSGNNNNDLIAKTDFSKGETRSYISNKVLVDGLTPNTTYSYRVGGVDGEWSEVYTFTTAKDNTDEFEFIYITDTQSNTDEMFEISRKTVATAQSKVPDARFVLMTGDLVETSGNSNSEWEWEQWFETMSASWQNLPIAPAQGNHDTSEKYSNWFNHFNTSKAFNAAQTEAEAKTTMEGTNYSFVYGDALFMVLTWEDYRKSETYFAAVEQWMKAQIAANPTKWQLVAFHKNMFTGSKSHQSDADGKIVRERMAPVFQEIGIDVVFEGHDHVYEVMGVMVAGKDADGKNTYDKVEGAVKNQTFTVGGTREDMTGIHGGTFNVSEGVLYFLNNSAGRKKYEPRTEAEMIAAESAHAVPGYYKFFHRFGQTGEPTFSKVNISSNEIKIATYTVNDAGEATLFDEFKVVETPNELNYTVPSWTAYQRTVKAGSPDASVLVSKNAPYNVNTAINGDPTKQFGATWYTNKGVTGTKLELIEGTSGDFSNARVFNASETALNDIMYVTSGNNNNDLIAKTDFSKGETRSYISNKVLMNNLKPNTTYSYRVGGIDGMWSEVYTFTTAKDNKDEFSFIYITDTQSNTDEMFEISRKTVTTAQTNVPDARFVLMTGDLVETSGNSNSEWEWEQWFETMSASWQDLPIAPAQGNHDTSEKYSNWFNHFNTSRLFNAAQTDNAAKTAMEGANYSFVYGDALFMVLTWEDYRKDETYFAAVEEWMKAQIAANADVKWKLVAFHKNMFTGSKSHQSDADGKIVRERMAPAFQDMGIDLVFEGHDHVYEVMGVMVAGKDADGKNMYSQVEGAVTNQTFETPSTLEENNPDMTGIHGGTFNVNEGVLYFLNNSAGKKKYQPRTEEEMIAAESAHAVPGYYQFFHRFGQTGEPTFSKVSISTEAIRIATYTVNDEGAATEFDAFEVVKNNGTVGITPLASISSISVYPNPASESITITTDETIETIRIVSMAGQVIVSQSGGNTVDVSNVNNGVYVLSVKTNNGVYTQQLVVKK